MNIRLPMVLALLLAMVTFGAHADFTLTFMEEPCTNLVNITDEYADYGVEFADVYRYVDSRDPWKDYSPTLGCGISYGLFGGGSFGNGLIIFEYPTPYATLDWWTIADDTIYADAYDSDDNIVDSFSGSGSGTYTLAGSESISYVTFHDSGGLVQVSNITYVRWTEVAIDIKFCSDPNGFNCRKNGVLPVTIFGTEEFDVASIDIGTLRLCTEGGDCTGAPRDYSTADRGDPDSDLGAAMCAINLDTGEEEDFLNPDGFTDLDVAFEASEVQEMLGRFCSDDKGTVSEPLVITGMTVDGNPITSVPMPNVGVDQLWKVDK